MRANVTGFKAGDTVEVWFTAGTKRRRRSPSPPEVDKSGDVLVHGGRGLQRQHEPLRRAPRPGPEYLSYYTKALADAGISYDVYDVDAHGRTAPDPLGVLSHYKAVIWYTGDDLYVREPAQPGGTGNSKLDDDEVIAIRDYLNDGGTVLVTGQQRAAGRLAAVALQPARAFPGQPQCRPNTNRPRARARPGSSRTACRCPTTSCSTGWAPTRGPTGDHGDRGHRDSDRRPVALQCTFSLTNQAFLPRFTPTSTSLPVAKFPQFASKPTHSCRAPQRRRRLDGGHATVGLRPGEHRRPRDVGDADPRGPRPARRATRTRRPPAAVGHRAGDAVADARRAGDLRRVHAGRGEGLHGVTTANVISTAGDAALTVADPGHLTNGAFSLPEPLQVAFCKSTWTAPVSNDPVTITFKQHIGPPTRCARARTPRRSRSRCRPPRRRNLKGARPSFTF